MLVALASSPPKSCVSAATGDRNEDQLGGLATFDAAAGEELADRIQHSIPVKQIPAYLNCHRTQAEMLVKQGTLKRIVPEKGLTASVLSNVAVRDLDEFLARFRANGLEVDQASEGMLNVIEASEIARWPTVDIVTLVLEGGLSRVEVLPAALKFKSVLVDPLEVKRKPSEPQETFHITVAQAAERLGVSTWGIRHLMSNEDRGGRPFLLATASANSKGAVRHFFELEEIERFSAAHAKLAQLALERGVSAKGLRKQLEEAGVRPIMPRVKLDAYLYRRADI